MKLIFCAACTVVQDGHVAAARLWGLFNMPAYDRKAQHFHANQLAQRSLEGHLAQRKASSRLRLWHTFIALNSEEVAILCHAMAVKPLEYRAHTPTASPPRIGPVAKSIFAIPPEPNEMTQISMLEALEAPVATESPGAIDAEMLVPRGSIGASGALSKGLGRLARWARGRSSQLEIFAVNSMNVLAVGLLIQVILVRYAGMGHISSYIAQTVASIQMSFLLSRYLACRNQNLSFGQALTRFNTQHLVVFGLGIGGYAGLERFGMNYVLANVAMTALLIPAGHLVGYKWSTGQLTQLSHRVAAAPWPLLAAMAVQVGLSLRLVWSNTASQDEALYLWAGHLEWAHWLHGTPVPDFATSFSGAPVIYPPLGALAYSMGGLAAARLLSLVFMLGATALLYGTTRRLYGHASAFFAVGLFATAGPVLHIGAFATFDAMAMFLLSLAAWSVTRSLFRRDPAVWLMAAAGALALANFTNYSTMVVDPIMLGFTLVNSSSRKGARIRVGALATYFTALLVIAGKLAGHSYIHAVDGTVLGRVAAITPASAVLHDALAWSWPILLAGAIGVAVGARYGHTSSQALLLAAPLLVIVMQVDDRTSTPLDEQLALGLWFAAIPAGYGLAAMAARSRSILRATALAAACMAVVLSSLAGIRVSSVLTESPDSAAFVAAFRPFASGAAPFLVEESTLAEYYEPAGAQWRPWWNTWNFDNSNVGITITADSLLYAPAIREGYFGVIALNSLQTPSLDQKIVANINASHRYYLAATIPYGSGYYKIWERSR